jgi:phospholipid/cholesterol/gamma-HCH transport system substrate-binding protein
MIISIIPGKGNEPSVQPGDEIHSYNRVRTDELLNTLSETNKNTAKLTSNLLKITHEIIQGKGTLGSLLNDTIISGDLKETMRYIKLTAKGASETVTKIDKLVSSLDKKDNVVGVIKDSAVANKIKNMVTHLEQSTTEINTVIANLNATILNIKDGKGSINYLSNNPKLVQKIDSTMTSINEASAKLSENMEAMRHNFLFRGYFKKQEKAKAKAAKEEENKK